MKTSKILFIGGGNMASALIGGLIGNRVPATDISVSEPDEARREQLAASWNIHTTTDNTAEIANSDVVVLAIKPQVARLVCTEISAALQQRAPLTLSIAAGISHTTMQSWIGQNVPLVRTMPNTPAMLQAGATGLYAGTNVSSEQKDLAETIMRAVGITQWVDDEKLIDAITAMSGSGPAYFFLFIEAMEQAGIKLGMTQEMAHLLSIQTALGASRMAMESNLSPQTLRQNVTSPGGTTEQAIKVFQEAGLESIVVKAMQAANARSQSIAAEFGAE